MIEIGVVLAGGTGSRLLPLTRRLNKHLLPVNGQPMLHWPLRTIARLGVERAVVVLGGQSCGEVIEHFGTRYDTGDGVLSLVYVHQQGAGGIPAALLCALDAVEAMRADRAIVILGDNVFPHVPAGLRSEMDAMRGFAHVVAKEMPDAATSYGCVPIDAHGRARPDLLVEKPGQYADNHPLHSPPEGTDWAALLGLYVLPVWNLRPILNALQPSARNELEIVDVLRGYQGEKALAVTPTIDPWIDAGDPPGYRLANDPAFWLSRSDLAGLSARTSS